MKTIKIWGDDPSSRQLDDICNVIEDGGVAIIPTDTIYGIVCDALNSKAVEKICRLKGINPDKTNLSIICSDIAMAAEYSRLDNSAFRLMKDNVPGAFTFLLKSASALPKAFKGRKIVGIRIPDSNTAKAIVERLGRPLLTTSIEFDDSDYAVSPSLIQENYEGKVDMMVEGEDGGVVPSTIVDCTGSEPEIVREGKGVLNY